MFHGFGLFHNLVYGAHIEERGFRIRIHPAFDNGLKTTDGLLYRHIFARHACKVLSHMEWLGQETLDLPGPVYCQLIFLRQFLHAKDCDDILKFLVFLKHLLYFVRHFIMLFPNHILFQDT